MAKNTYIGAGTTLSSNYYMRNFYVSNRNARTPSKRKDIDNSELALADGMALRRAIKQLVSLKFDDEKDSDIRNSVKAFIDTFNNTLDSTSDSTDHALNRSMKQLKSIAQEYASDLDKIGITVNSDGTLTRRDTLFTTASLSKFEKLFSSGSDFIQRTSACAKRIERRSDALSVTEKHQKLLENTSNQTGSTVDTTAVAQLISDGTDLDTLLNTGIGQNVNVVL